MCIDVTETTLVALTLSGRGKDTSLMCESAFTLLDFCITVDDDGQVTAQIPYKNLSDTRLIGLVTI